MSKRTKLDRDLERIAKEDGLDLFPAGTYSAGEVKGEIYRVDGPGGPQVNPRVRPVKPKSKLFEDFLGQVLTLELPRLLQHLLDGASYEQKASPKMFEGTKMHREGWSLCTDDGKVTVTRAADGSTATVDATVLQQWVVLALEAAVHPFGDGKPKEPAWVDKGRELLGSKPVKDLPALD